MLLTIVDTMVANSKPPAVGMAEGLVKKTWEVWRPHKHLLFRAVLAGPVRMRSQRRGSTKNKGNKKYSHLTMTLQKQGQIAAWQFCSGVGDRLDRQFLVFTIESTWEVA